MFLLPQSFGQTFLLRFDALGIEKLLMKVSKNYVSSRTARILGSNGHQNLRLRVWLAK